MNTVNVSFVINNQQHSIVDVLNPFLAQHSGYVLDFAATYFNEGAA